MTRNYHVHVLTLAQVPPILRVEGSWPGPVVFTAGWFRARARPWNEVVTNPMVRLDRGGAEFLHSVTEHFAEVGELTTFSPALYAGSTRVWRRSGFDDHETLNVMERSLDGRRTDDHDGNVRVETEPNWSEILEIDRLAFEGFWGMSQLGLREAYGTNRSVALLVAPAAGRPTGYAIVGSQWATVFLHRVAVRPDHTGQGIGATLVSAAVDWGCRVGGRSMILNVRPSNARARQLYHRLGFTDTKTPLRVLRHRHIC